MTSTNGRKPHAVRVCGHCLGELPDDRYTYCSAECWSMALRIRIRLARFRLAGRD